MSDGLVAWEMKKISPFAPTKSMAKRSGPKSRRDQERLRCAFEHPTFTKIDKAEGGKSVPVKVTVNGKRFGGERSGGNVKKKHKK